MAEPPHPAFGGLSEAFGHPEVIPEAAGSHQDALAIGVNGELVDDVGGCELEWMERSSLPVIVSMASMARPSSRSPEICLESPACPAVAAAGQHKTPECDLLIAAIVVGPRLNRLSANVFTPRELRIEPGA